MTAITETSAAKPAEWYCPTCARPRGDEHHPDECVCAGTDVHVPGRPVHVPGGQRAALDRLVAWPGGASDRAIMSAVESTRMLAALRVKSPRRPPVAIGVALTHHGWRIWVEPAAVQLTLDAEPAATFVAELPVCSCAVPVKCTAYRCEKTRGRDGHCHAFQDGVWSGKGHAEHVEAFIAALAKTYGGRGALVPTVPRHPDEDCAAGKAA